MRIFPLAEQHELGFGFQFGGLASGCLDVGHHLDLFAVAAVVDCPFLNVVDFIDDSFVYVPLKLGLRGAKTGRSGVHFLQDCAQRPGFDGRLRQRGTGLKERPEERDRQDERESFHFSSNL